MRLSLYTGHRAPVPGRADGAATTAIRDPDSENRVCGPQQVPSARKAICRLSKSSSMRSRRNSRKSGTLSMPPTGVLHWKLSRDQFGSSQGFTAKGGGTMQHMLP